MAGGRPLTAGEWSLLALLREEPRHGWALAGELAPEGPIGRIWSLSRPLVYRGIDQLGARGLIEVAGETASERGPTRTLLRLTAAGRRAVDGWLGEPVAHVRDVRPDLLLKVVFAHRLGRSPEALLRVQQPILEQVVAALEAGVGAAEGTEAVVLRYRLETARAALRFVAGELTPGS